MELTAFLPTIVLFGGLVLHCALSAVDEEDVIPTPEAQPEQSRA